MQDRVVRQLGHHAAGIVEYEVVLAPPAERVGEEAARGASSSAEK